MKTFPVLPVLCLAIGCSNAKAPAPPVSPEAAQIRDLQARVTALENAKPAHQYQLVSQGSRTFRFDPATGDSCIQLTSHEDWKRPETIRQGCQYTDWAVTPRDRLTAECYLVGNKKACQELVKPDNVTIATDPPSAVAPTSTTPAKQP